MAQPSKGDRKQIRVALDRPTKAQIICLARSLGLGASDYISDVMAFSVGMPEFVIRLRQEALLYARPPAAIEDAHLPDDGVMGPRFPDPVYTQIRRAAQLRGVPMAHYVAAVMAEHLGDQAIIAHEQEVLLTSA